MEEKIRAFVCVDFPDEVVKEVARVKHVRDLGGFYEYVRNISVKPLSFEVKGFRLMKSELRSMGPVYTGVEGFG